MLHVCRKKTTFDFITNTFHFPIFFSPSSPSSYLPPLKISNYLFQIFLNYWPSHSPAHIAPEILSSIFVTFRLSVFYKSRKELGIIGATVKCKLIDFWRMSI